MSYAELFEERYAEQKLYMSSPPETKLEFIANDVFDFTTYDGAMDNIFAQRMLEVCECILNGTQFQYQESDDKNYENYLLMVNMPFLNGKLNWGSSIRGAWFDKYGNPSEEPFYNIGIFPDIPKEDIDIFITELINWSKV